ncbi:unnamed protein product [Symbiodinium necroappetens]|uniref:Uncharacterized protein n=1 Tax=Symbiodinium necroappetens TaxID=1628268 RepID=A0A812MKW1_9DINO|nr:unnamed protein product [Symbiodinium necroappetens]
MGNALPAANRERLHLRNLACSLGRMPREDCREAKRPMEGQPWPRGAGVAFTMFIFARRLGLARGWQ